MNRYISVVLILAVACAPAMAQTKHADEPPLVGTVLFRTSTHSDKLDINTASKRQISVLPGMAIYADKIVASRPYTTKLDLVKRGIMPQAAYDKVKDRIIAHRVKKATSAHSATATKSR